MKKDRRNFIAPDGGWGWMVCLGNSLINLSLRSLDPSFGLLFADLLKSLKVETTGASVIMSALEAMLNFSGLIVGPMIKKFSCRKVAIFGSVLSCMGLMLTSQANSFAYIICTYSILGGFGTGLATIAGFVSLNSFFHLKRTQVVGLSMAGTTFGMMCMPQIVHLLLSKYDFRGAVLIIGSIALHAVLGSFLLHPVSWYLVPEFNGTELKSLRKDETIECDKLLNKEKKEVNGKSRKLSAKSNASDMSSIDLKRDDSEYEEFTQENKTADEKKGGKSIAEKFVDFFDLTLLTDRIYLNILMGLSLGYLADINYKMITPFFLDSIGMPNGEIAFCLTLAAFADVVSRLTMPIILTKLKIKNRTVFWVSTTLLAISRSVTAELKPGLFLIIALSVNGFLRGISLTNFNLTISEHCAQDELPDALGILNVTKGLFIVSLGPLLGFIRDSTGSYGICLHTTTLFVMFYSSMWGLELLMQKIRERRNKFEKDSEFAVS